MLTILLVTTIIVVMVFVLNKNAANKFKSALSALLGKGADKAIELDPVSVYRDRVEKSADELKKAVGLLESHAALITQLKRKLKADTEEHSLVESRIKKHMEENNTEKANEYAEKLVELEDKLEHLKQKLTTAENTYRSQAKKIMELKGKIVEYKDKAGRLKSDLQTSKAEAEISNLTQKFDSNSLGFDDLKEIEDVIQDQIDKNESKAAVAQDLQIPDFKAEIVNEVKAKKAQDVLERFKKKD